MAQLLQVDEDAIEKVPARQPLQLIAPEVDAYVPTAQLVQAPAIVAA